ncbi:hypothetical protein K438DRAFT_1971067 [Mycena galopus ATCC 62051]|nr:hypothetical protein K438DRAFT_1971067 [Mycena galopus ATCC 62051]
MFSKILAFGLGALAVVNAAPAVFSFQTPMLSCSVNMLGTSQAVVKAFDKIPAAGQYKISNKNFPNNPGPYGVWDMVPVEEGSALYTITNLGFNAPLHYSPTGLIVVGGPNGANFLIESAGGGDYVIKLGDQVWTIGSSLEALHLEPQQQGAAKQLWRFDPVN